MIEEGRASKLEGFELDKLARSGEKKSSGRTSTRREYNRPADTNPRPADTVGDVYRELAATFRLIGAKYGVRLAHGDVLVAMKLREALEDPHAIKKLRQIPGWQKQVRERMQEFWDDDVTIATESRADDQFCDPDYFRSSVVDYSVFKYLNPPKPPRTEPKPEPVVIKRGEYNPWGDR